MHETAGKHDWLQTGEMIQIGRAWRITGLRCLATAAKTCPPSAGRDCECRSLNESIKPLIDKLSELDKNQPQSGNPDTIVKYNLTRAELLEQIAAADKDDQRENWIRQVADCYSTAAQSGAENTAPYEKLVALRDRMAKAAPGSPLAGYIAFREMSTDYAAKLSSAKPDAIGKLQEDLARQAESVRRNISDGRRRSRRHPAAWHGRRIRRQRRRCQELVPDARAKAPEEHAGAESPGSGASLDVRGQAVPIDAATIKNNCAVQHCQCEGQNRCRLLLGELEPADCRGLLHAHDVAQGNAGNVEVSA